MKSFVYLLYVIQFTFSIALYIPNWGSINFIGNTVNLRDRTWMNESVTTQSLEISSESPDSNSSIATAHSSTQRSTSSTGRSTTNILSALKDHLPILIGIGGGTFVCVVLSVCICCCCRRRRSKKRRKSRGIRSNYDPFGGEEIEMPPIPRPIISKKSLKSSRSKPCCPYMVLAKEFVASLQWQNSVFDPEHDQCYCTNCYPTSWADVTQAGNAEYVIPRGWARIGLYVDAALANQHSIWNEWIVTFHGTTIVAAQSILASRQFCLPGDMRLDGNALKIREGHIPNKKHIYTSPTIAYSSLPVYSPTIDFYSQNKNCSYDVQIVLQCRQKPNTYTIQGETVGFETRRICPIIPNHQIEYFTEIRPSLVAYGLLVKLV